MNTVIKPTTMKKKLIFLLAVLFCTTSFAQRIIENPSFEITNSGIYHISKIECSKDATRVHIHNTFIPKWWISYEKDIFIQLDNGTKINIIDVEGAKFDEKITMPESGEYDVVLLFPPIPDEVKKLDYNNQIFSVSLVEGAVKNNNSEEVPQVIIKWIDNELKKVTKKPLANFNSKEFFNKSGGRLIGYIKGYDSRLGFTNGIIYAENELTRENYPVVIEIHPDGRFEGDVPLTNPSNTYIVFNKKPVKFYLEPQQTLAMILDWDEFLYADRMRNAPHNFQKIIFKGSLAKINEELMNYNQRAFDYKSFSKKKSTIAPVAFKEEEAIEYKKNLTNLDNYLKNKPISDKAKILLKNQIDLEHANHLFDFVMDRKYQIKQDSTNLILKIPVENNYFDFLQNFNLNDQSLLVAREFSTFVNRFEYSQPISIYPKPNPVNYTSFTPEKTLEQYLEEEKITITEKDKSLNEGMKNRTFKSVKELRDYQNQYSDTFKKASEAYSKKYVEPFINTAKKAEIVTMDKWKLRDSVVKNVFHLDKNLVYEIIKVRAIDFDIKRSNTENAHTYWKELKKDITHPFLQEEGLRIVNKQFPLNTIQNNPLIENSNQKLAINAIAETNKLPEGKEAEIFKNIIKPYKGKILFVDFWATTCGPCVAGIKSMKETRKEYKDNKDFEFVFITDEAQSPIDSYNKFVKEQELENIHRVTTDDYNYLRQLFRFNGIPRYVVIDKKGDIINDKFEMHNFNHLINGILEKYK